MEQFILNSKYEDKYVGGTHITIIEECEIESNRHKIVQIMPLASLQMTGHCPNISIT